MPKIINYVFCCCCCCRQCYYCCCCCVHRGFFFALCAAAAQFSVQTHKYIKFAIVNLFGALCASNKLGIEFREIVRALTSLKNFIMPTTRRDFLRPNICSTSVKSSLFDFLLELSVLLANEMKLDEIFHFAYKIRCGIYLCERIKNGNEKAKKKKKKIMCSMVSFTNISTGNIPGMKNSTFAFEFEFVTHLLNVNRKMLGMGINIHI